ncbi:MAG: hypothetical protein CR961_01035, partial [Polaribacter sp.]
SVGLISCFRNNKTKDKTMLGVSPDGIKLSKKDFVINNQKQRLEIETKGEWWWFNDIKINEKHIQFDMEKSAKKDFKIENEDIKIKRKNATNFYIEISKNKSNTQRNFVITLQSGNYFDYIKISQKP